MKTVFEKEKNSFAELKGKFGHKNSMSSPRLIKIVVSAGVGSLIKKDRTKGDLVIDRLSKITGQRPASRGAKKAISTFKTRIGDIVGYVVTLRGRRMYSFLDKLLNVALPRTKDFRGISRGAVDTVGNLSIGIKEHNIFPEAASEELKDLFGFSITLVSTAKTKDEALAFFELLGVPFKKSEEGKGKK